MKLLLLVLFSFIQIAQAQGPIYLDENGVTLKAGPEAQVGRRYTFRESDYLIVDEALLRKTVEASGDVSRVVLKGVRDLSYLFYKQTEFNQDISHWDTSGVVDMTLMFTGATNFSGDLSAWDVSGVKDFGDMFRDTKNFNSDLSDWDVSGAQYLNGMFHNSNFNRNINTWDVSNVVDFSGMFDDATSFNQPLDAWDMRGAINLGGMFAEAINFNQDISHWDVSNVEIMTNMFRNARSFSVDLSGWNVQSITGVPEEFNLNADNFIVPKWQRPLTASTVGIVGVVVLILVLAIWYFRRKKQHDAIQKPEKLFQERLIDFLATKNSNYISKEELDQVFQIEGLSFESQKTKRAQIIKRLNESAPNTIKRVRNPEDKRVFMYLIKI